MSFATVPTNKLPFAIQTILGDDDKPCEISDWERSICENNALRDSCDQGYLPQYPITDSVVPYHHLPRQSLKTSFEVTSLVPSTNHSKFIQNPLLASGTEARNYPHYNHFPFSEQYSPVRYGFASTSVPMPDRLAQSIKFGDLPSLPDIELAKLSANSSNQLCFLFNPYLPDSRITKTTGNKQTVSHSNGNYGRDGFYPNKSSSSFPIVIAPLGCTAIGGSAGSDSAKLQKKNRRDSFTVQRRIGHSYLNRNPVGYKKPRTSFTKKQVASLESKFLAQKYLASTERVNLANQLEMSDMQVKTWFQNRRTKWRKQEAEERECEDKEKAKLMACCSKCFFARPDVEL
uniref:Homeobox domain-containing protein n=1 Tax=Elaeophora elaphi TaxID=1147741 RepID=A0A0R3RVY8_9BILA